MVSQSPRSVPIQDDPRFLSAMITRPPRPPSWRDFLPKSNTPVVSPTKRGDRTKGRRVADHLGFSDLTSAHRSRSEGNDLSRVGLSSSGSTMYLGGLTENRAATLPHLKHHKKHKNRLHRTRSQVSIEKTDLPDKEQMTQSLAETKPKEIGLCSKQPLDQLVHQAENNRKCEKWLAGVQAVVFAQEMGIPEEHSSDQDSSSGSKSRSMKVAPYNASSSSDIDSVSIVGASSNTRSRHSPGKTKSAIPVLESHRKSKSRHSQSPDNTKVKVKVKDTLKNNTSLSQGTEPPSLTKTSSPSVSAERNDSSGHQQQSECLQRNDGSGHQQQSECLQRNDGSGQQQSECIQPTSTQSTENNRTTKMAPLNNEIMSVNSINKNNNVKTIIVNSNKSAVNSCESRSDVIAQEPDNGVQNHHKVALHDIESLSYSEGVSNSNDDVAMVTQDSQVPCNPGNKALVLWDSAACNTTNSVKQEADSDKCYTVPGYTNSPGEHRGQEDNTAKAGECVTLSKEHTGSHVSPLSSPSADMT